MDAEGQEKEIKGKKQQEPLKKKKCQVQCARLGWHYVIF